MWINAKILGANQKRGTAEQPKRGDKSFVMSRTELVRFCLDKEACPAKWIAGEAEQKESKTMDFGSLIDCLATTPDKLWSKFAITPKEYPATAKKKGEPSEMKPWNNNATYCKEWNEIAECEGKTVISQRMFDEAQLAMNQLKSNDAIAELLDVSERQVLVGADWKDEGGLIVPFAGLIDLVPPSGHATWGKTIADIKTARNGNPAQWARVCDDSGYDVQAALYLDLYCAATGEDRTDFVHVVQENTFPFHVVSPPPLLSTEFLDWGRSKYRRALKLYCQCLATGIWPSYPHTGIPFGHSQIISPDSLWNYRTLAGEKEFQMPTEKPSPYTAGIDVQP